MASRPGTIDFLKKQPELVDLGNYPRPEGRRGRRDIAIENWDGVCSDGPYNGPGRTSTGATDCAMWRQQCPGWPNPTDLRVRPREAELKDKEDKYVVFYGGAQIAMVAVAGLLVIFCALLTGLTLAICGLDMNYLQLRSVTGSPRDRRRAQKVLYMKKHSTWMLCSLVLVSVACSQTFPFVIQSIYHGSQAWVPILISTLTMAIFVEILPQYIIPKQAVAWGYHCWLIIWGCMWATCVVTWPLAWLLDSIYTKRDKFGVFKNKELGAVIKYHEASAKNGGKLGKDATRIMLGALKLDSQRLDGDVLRTSDSSLDESSQDLEKATSPVSRGVIVKWSAVKTVNIKDIVDEAFITKVKSWSYSRIPVVGGPPLVTDENGIMRDPWEDNQIFGFLHVKYLIGLDTQNEAKSETKLTVRDLPLYPVPIVRDDMSVYELLNLFQMGMSRMAVVVHESLNEGVSDTAVDARRTHDKILWTATAKTNTHLMSNVKGGKGKDYWTMDYLKAAQAAAADPAKPRQNVIGIRCPRPIGIVTFEDIIDTILQKTSRDESDFFVRDTSFPPTKSRKAGDPRPKAGPISPGLPRAPKQAHVSFDQSVNLGTLRQRKVSDRARARGGLDGADDGRPAGQNSIRIPKRRKSTGSSYTNNSDGGFHGVDEPHASMDCNILMTAEEILEMANTSSSDCAGNPYSRTNVASSPKGRSESRIPGGSSTLKHSLRDVSPASRIRPLRRVGQFSRGGSSSFDREKETPNQEEQAKGVSMELTMPVLSALPEEQEMKEISKLSIPVSQSPFAPPGPIPRANLMLEYSRNFSGLDMESFGDTLDSMIEPNSGTRIKSGETTSLMSWSSDDDAHLFRVYDAYPVPAGERHEVSFFNNSLSGTSEGREKTKPYDGFPPELLDITNKNNRVPDFVSKTLPRSMANQLARGLCEERETPRAREGSFHDDRAMLPSQRMNLTGSLGPGGNRSLSLWF
ncbi:hypothetical protein MBM_06291 [Drepanopeziza brunnea f. sp. 'multigermtubi' MB_m1]|uniref:CNNM transmembrane domain-containing protein n=1 Tax=Marssonina brunnea f. sp. multigermtubi (strain MB_m1) TaxID=1072389 RepID=K1X4U2_MARBU|nr:uncharacterized protein MBM_06291 [Drepanopeziza brunnea f. sp. 'multigermtubi' MB_m1]EKD15663.1 hypothetical protein MBM_06291 [Drepanopeziza brunnea f. sp. 'multigermtubi' MB_m1]